MKRFIRYSSKFESNVNVSESCGLEIAFAEAVNAEEIILDCSYGDDRIYLKLNGLWWVIASGSSHSLGILNINIEVPPEKGPNVTEEEF